MSRILSWHDWLDTDRRVVPTPPSEEDLMRGYGRTFVVTPAPQQEEGPITKFMVWYAEAHRGDVYVYHVGFLMIDRDGEAVMYLDSLARLVLDYALKGRVALTQRRLGELQYEYRATKL